ncbi:MAG: hypothetical protein IT215_00775 [Chitinophagaceae bacterium]|nr:hypothetical protein [Chitinophagaceae bacterium]
MNYSDRFAPKQQKEIPKDRMDNWRLASCFSYFPLEKSILNIDLNRKNSVVSKKGTRITIHPGSFLYANFAVAHGQAVVHIWEALDSFDYMRAGIGHIYYDKHNRINYMDLGGMFKIEIFQGNNRLRIASEKFIDIEFPDITPGKRMNLFVMNETGNWVQKKDAGSIEVFKPDTIKKESSEIITGVRKVSIEFLTWWSFAMPTTESTSLKGDWEDPKSIAGKNYQVVAISQESLYYSMKWFNNKDYVLPAPLNKKITVFLCDDLGNYAISNEFSAGGKVGYEYLPEASDNFRFAVEKLKFDKIPPASLKNAESLKEFYKIPTVNRKVLYPE